MNENFRREFELYEAESNAKKNVKYIGIGILAFAAVCIGIAGVVFGINGFGADTLANSVTIIEVHDDADIPYVALGDSAEIINIITAETKMVYEYYFPELNFTDFVEAVAPHLLIGASESSLGDLMPGWEIIKFSPREVVARKTILPGTNLAYLLTTRNGYIAVYYEDAIHGGLLKEVTSTSIAGLCADEVSRLERGIYIYGIENLMSALQDFGS
ncbi:MAG: hypothetical protein FWE29_01470 [Defluviitaleaceae bacterium]|nr:hypothetical protein [Defluviitaleaceae bacterium]